MRIIVDEGFTSFNLLVTRHCSDYWRLSRFLAMSSILSPEKRLSGRGFDSATMVCAEIQLDQGETIVCDEVVRKAEEIGWFVTDFEEFFSFCLGTIQGYSNSIPLSLLSTFFIEGGMQKALQLTRTGWDLQVRFFLDCCTPLELHGEQHVLLVKELALD